MRIFFTYTFKAYIGYLSIELKLIDFEYPADIESILHLSPFRTK